MTEHGKDLRAEIQDEPNADLWVETLKKDHRLATLSKADRVMLEFAIKLTLEPRTMGRPDIENLRQVGFDDTAIHDITQVTALFNYYNRLADGLGIHLEG